MPAARNTSTHLLPCNDPLPSLGINVLDDITLHCLSLHLTSISIRGKKDRIINKKC